MSLQAWIISNLQLNFPRSAHVKYLQASIRHYSRFNVQIVFSQFNNKSKVDATKWVRSRLSLALSDLYLDVKKKSAIKLWFISTYSNWQSEVKLNQISDVTPNIVGLYDFGFYDMLCENILIYLTWEKNNFEFFVLRTKIFISQNSEQ